jgi:peptidoglycan hydrolase-like protein with peptidoglycan-binding domain
MKKKNNNMLIIAVGTGVIALGYFLYPTLKNLFRKKEKSAEIDTTETEITTAPGSSTSGTETTKTETKEITKPKIDEFSQRLTKGSKGDNVKRVQTILNDVASLRKQNEINGVQMPLKIDGIFGANTEKVAKAIFTKYKESGYITVNQARSKWAFSRGYYNQVFPQALVTSKAYNLYQDQYRLGKIENANYGKKKKQGQNINNYLDNSSSWLDYSNFAD